MASKSNKDKEKKHKDQDKDKDKGRVKDNDDEDDDQVKDEDSKHKHKHKHEDKREHKRKHTKHKKKHHKRSKRSNDDDSDDSDDSDDELRQSLTVLTTSVTQISENIGKSMTQMSADIGKSMAQMSADIGKSMAQMSADTAELKKSMTQMSADTAELKKSMTQMSAAIGHLVNSDKAFRLQGDTRGSFKCQLLNRTTGDVAICNVEVDTGNRMCDLILPARDAYKLRLFRTGTTKLAEGFAGSQTTLAELTGVYLSVSLPHCDTQKVAEKHGLLTPWTVNQDYEDIVTKQGSSEPDKGLHSINSWSASSSSSSASSYAPVDSMIQAFLAGQVKPTVSPINHQTGTAKSHVLLGRSGCDRLNLSYQLNSLSYIDVPLRPGVLYAKE